MAYGAVAAVAAVGTFVTAGLATGIVAAVIGGAVIGAAIGGISAAITGGSIGKGILFGAIGGAVTAGLGAWASGFTGAAGAAGGVTGASSVGASEMAAAGTIGGSASTYTPATMAAASTTTGAAGAGLTSGEGMVGQALVTTAGSALAGAFDDSAEIAAKEKQADREASERLAKLQAETQLKIAEMQSGGGGGGSNGDARYTADLQLQNAREQRSQDYKLKQEEYSLLEEQRARRAGAVKGVMAAKESGPQAPTNIPSIDQQVYGNDNQMYAQQQPADAQSINQQGVMRPEYA